MTRWLRFLRTLMALCAIVAYTAPVAAHHAPATHAHMTPQGAAPCPGHDGGPDHPPSRHHHEALASDIDANGPEAPPKCPAHKDGSVSCCVAMCHAALPMPEVVAPWIALLKASSDSRIVDLVGPAFVVRLDRPPKPGIALIG